ncbi:MAG: hypothetical protein KC442_20430 [Thermomicrobiales bacterium]|nr:hypothetical protein [Thermomicrobiales bacterium]
MSHSSLPAATVRPAPGSAAPDHVARLSTRQVAQRAHISERSVRRAIAAGELSAMRVGGRYWVRSLDADRWAVQRLRPPADQSVADSAARDGQSLMGLPRPASSFIGRTEELAALHALLADPSERIVTLIGPGGIGKTRLAIEAAATQQTHWPDGVVFVPLDTVREPELVLPAVAQAIGAGDPGELPLADALLQVLQPRRLLLVLDNGEHLLEAAGAAAALLATAPHVQLLVTSRAPLRVSGERLFAVHPLGFASNPCEGRAEAGSDAGQLFLDRAQRHAVLPLLGGQNTAAIDEICRRLDGLPLAIELAAASTRLFTPAQINERLRQRQPLPAVGPRDAPARHLTLRDTVAWSDALLSPAARALFRRLAAFVGGFSLATVQAVAQASGAGGPAGADPVWLLAELMDQSLVQPVADHGSGARYVMLETIREYGQEQLAATGQLAAAQTLQAQIMLSQVADRAPLGAMHGQAACLAWLTAERANLRAALAWFSTHGPQDAFVTLAAALGLAWFPYEAYREGAAWLERALALPGVTPLQRARLLIGLGGVRFSQGQLGAIEAALAEAQRLLAAEDAPLECALLHTLRGATLNCRREPAAAERELQRALVVAGRIPDDLLRAGMTGRVLGNLVAVAREAGDLPRAEGFLRQALAWYDGRELDLAEAITWLSMGNVAQTSGDYRAALRHWHRGLAALGPQAVPRMVADALAGSGAAAAALGEPVTALLLFGAADALRTRAGAVSVLPLDGLVAQRGLAEARRVLGAGRARALLAQGRTLRQAEAVALLGALAGAQPAPRALSRRQQEVLAHLARNLTDREIADALFLSQRTVSWHVRAILEYFGAETRSEAVARAHSDGLLSS